MERVELNVHTCMSEEYDGVINVKELLQFASKHHMKAVAITDRDSVGIYPEVYQLAKQMKTNKELPMDFKVIYGTEVLLKDDVEDESYPTIILVESQSGFRNLYRLISESATTYFNGIPEIPKMVLNEYREGLLVGCGCGYDNGELYHAILRGDTEERIATIVSYYDYLAVLPTKILEFFIQCDCGKEINCSSYIQEVNKKIVLLGKQWNKPVVAVSNADFLYREDGVFHQAVRRYRGWCNIDKDTERFVRTTEEMVREFSYLGDECAYEIVVKNTNDIADKIKAEKPIETQKQIVDIGDYDLHSVCVDRARKIYGNPLPKVVQKRLEWEISVVRKNRFEYIFKLLSELIEKFQLKQFEVQTRGVLYSSLIAYLLEITDIDPIKYNLSPYFAFGYHGDVEPKIVMDVPEELQEDIRNCLSTLSGVASAYYVSRSRMLSEYEKYTIFSKYIEGQDLDIMDDAKECMVNRMQLCHKCRRYHLEKVIIPKGNEIYSFSPIRKTYDGFLTLEFQLHELENTFPAFTIGGFWEISFIKLLAERTGIYPTQIALDDELVCNYFQKSLWKDKNFHTIIGGNEQFFRDLYKTIQPYGFKAVAKTVALAHGTNVWTDNQKNLFENGSIDINSLISSREDVFEYLLSKGIEEEKAYLITDSVGQGEGLTLIEEEKLREVNVDDIVINILKKINYIFPRGWSLSNALRTWRLAYYKIYYPKIFKECFNEIKEKN